MDETFDDAQATRLMARFGKAYFSRDPQLLAQVITEDAEWHFAFGTDVPNGRVRKGLAGFLQGIRDNEALFERLKFLNVECRTVSANHIVMTYLVDGQYRSGQAFSLRGIELILIRDGKVALKDVFWKQAG
jgi:ketosteroid isomerase-like protein